MEGRGITDEDMAMWPHLHKRNFRPPVGSEDTMLSADVLMGVEDGIPIICVPFVTTNAEREQIAAGTTVWLVIQGTIMPPVGLSVVDDEGNVI